MVSLTHRGIMPGRTLAIGDIHGCADALAALVAELDPGPDDLVVTLGDYIDRGPDSRGVLEQLIALSARCRLVPILGNHDQALLELCAGRSHGWFWLGMGGMATLGSYGLGWGEFGAIPREHLAFLEGCLPGFETEMHLFLHAQYEPDRPLDQQPEEALRWRSLRDVQPPPHYSGKRAIVGHSSQKSGEILDLGHIVCIDTRCYGGGWLTAFEVETGRAWQADIRGRLRASRNGRKGFVR